MKYDLGDVYTMTPQEVAEQLVNGTMTDDERIKDVCFEDRELNITIKKVIEDDPRCSGYVVRVETFDIWDIRELFVHGDYYTWAKDEDGDDVLLCFGCC
jgi:hypothetical protein